MDERIIHTGVRRCPNCGIETKQSTVGQRAGAALGAGIGGILGFLSADTRDNRVATALAGFFSGATTGLGVGKVLDEQVFNRYHCHRCDITLNA